MNSEKTFNEKIDNLFDELEYMNKNFLKPMKNKELKTPKIELTDEAKELLTPTVKMEIALNQGVHFNTVKNWVNGTTKKLEKPYVQKAIQKAIKLSADRIFKVVQ